MKLLLSMLMIASCTTLLLSERVESRARHHHKHKVVEKAVQRPLADAPAKETSWKKSGAVNSSEAAKGVTIQDVTFATTVDAGLAKAFREQKPLFVYMKKRGCPQCLTFETSALKEPMIRDFLDSNFVCALVLSGSKDEDILKRDFGCNAFPHFVVFKKDGKLVGKWFALPKSADDFLNKIHSMLIAGR